MIVGELLHPEGIDASFYSLIELLRRLMWSEGATAWKDMDAIEMENCQ